MLRRIIGWLPILGFAAVAGGVMFQRWGSRRDRLRYPPAGRLVETSAGLFHVDQSFRDGAVTVVLESGLAGSSLSWSMVQKEVAGFAPVLSYDRAGFGWSSPARSPRHLKAIVDELGELLVASGVRAPYLLVGHSFGGLIVRAFAHQFPRLVAGLILLDPVSTRAWASCEPEELARLERGMRLARRGALLAESGFLRLILHLVIAGSRVLPLIVARVSAPGATSFLQRMAREISKLPEPLWPVVRAQWSRPMGFRSIHAYLVALRKNCSAAEAQRFEVVAPSIILSAATATADELKERERWQAGRNCAQHVVIPECGHWIQVERTDLVTEVIRQMVLSYEPLLPFP